MKRTLLASLCLVSNLGTAASQVRDNKSVNRLSFHTSNQNCEEPQGSTGMHRLSQKEYLFALEDLFAMALPDEVQMEKETAIDGFHNNADALGFTEAYQTALLLNAEKITDHAFQQKGFFPCKNGNRDCAVNFVSGFAKRAYRRPLLQKEKDRIASKLDLFLTQYSYQLAVKSSLRSILNSPFFILHGLEDQGAGQQSYVLASRLSFLIWQSIPDQTLLDLAANKQIDKTAELTKQIDRMLKDPRSDRFIDTFVHDWLGLDDFETLSPDSELYPQFSEQLRQEMLAETKAFMRYILFQKRPLEEILLAEYSWLNKKMADFYGLEGRFSADFKKVNLKAKNRLGLLTQAAILGVTSTAGDSSVVGRGKWVLGNIVCRLPPNPPGNFELPEEDPQKPQSKRERFAQHRANPACAGCHVEMDPIGFGFDNFDVIGSWREEDVTGFPIDSTGELLGTSFTHPLELVHIIAENEVLVDCLAQKLATFSLGRVLTAGDRCRVKTTSSDLNQQDSHFQDLLGNYIDSELFQIEGARP